MTTATSLALAVTAAMGWAGQSRLAPTAGVETTLKAEGTALKIGFRKVGDERRLLAAEVDSLKRSPEAKALAVTYSLRVEGGEARLALVVFAKSGAVWFKTGSRPLEAGKAVEARLSLKALRKAEFARGGGKELDWQGVEKLWVGVVLDGKASGELVLHSAEVTDRPYRPTKPLMVQCADPKQWSIARDPAATAAATAAKDALGGGACVRIDFTFPGGRHMYVVPSVRMNEAELGGYRALRLTYKATVPKGIDGLLVMLIERDGTQYQAQPAPPGAAEWKTLTIPLKQFRRGGWSKDENDRLDLDDIRSVAVGVHGTARDAQARGTICISRIELVP